MSSIGAPVVAGSCSAPITIDADRALRMAATRSPIDSSWPATSPPSSSDVATSARSAVSTSRCSASVARRRVLAARPDTTTAVTTYTASANQLRESDRVNVCTGGRKNQLKASMLAIETSTA